MTDKEKFKKLLEEVTIDQSEGYFGHEDFNEQKDFFNFLYEELEKLEKMQELFEPFVDYVVSSGFYNSCEFDDTTPLGDAIDEVSSEIGSLIDYTEATIEDAIKYLKEDFNIEQE